MATVPNFVASRYRYTHYFSNAAYIVEPNVVEKARPVLGEGARGHGPPLF
jgi:hypothetical protein